MKIFYLSVGNLSNEGIFYSLKACFPEDEIIFLNVRDIDTSSFTEGEGITILDCEGIDGYIDKVTDVLSAVDIPVLTLAIDSMLLMKLNDKLPELRGMINRNGSSDFLIKAVGIIIDGGYCYSWDKYCRTEKEFNREKENENLYKKIGLTRREKEILQFYIAGESNKSISLRLARSEKTISAHKSNIKKKLRVKGISFSHVGFS